MSNAKEFGLKLLDFILKLGFVFSLVGTVASGLGVFMIELIPDLAAQMGIDPSELPALTAWMGGALTLSGVSLKTSSAVKTATQSNVAHIANLRNNDRKYYDEQIAKLRLEKNTELEAYTKSLAEQLEIEKRKTSALEKAVEVEKNKHQAIINKNYRR